MATVEKSSRRIVQFVTATQSVKLGYATLLEVLMEPQQELKRTPAQRNRKLPLRSTTAQGTMSTIVVVAVPGRSARRTHSPSGYYSRDSREERGASASSLLLNSNNITAINNLVSEHLANGKVEEVNLLLTAVSALYAGAAAVGTPVVSSTSQSLKPAAPSIPAVNSRMNPTDFAAVTIFFGTEDDKNFVVDRMDQYEAFVEVPLKSRAGMADELQ